MNKKTVKTALIILFSLVILLVLVFSFLPILKKDVAPEKEKPDPSRLRTLPYLSGTYEAPQKVKVTRFNPDMAYEGLNLYISAHRTAAFLMDMDGKELYRWRFNFKNAFPDTEGPHVWYSQKQWKKYWRRVHLFRNGDLLAIYEGNGLIKIDKHSNLIWAAPGYFHHDLEVMGDKICALNRRMVTLPRIHEKEPILEDLITILDAEGQIIDSVSILELFENSEFMPLLEGRPPFGDIFHTNTLEIFDGTLAKKSPLFKKGNALISMRMTDIVAIADLEAKKIVWAQKPGFWKTQHQPTLLNNGNMLLFNNLYIEQKSDKAEFELLRKTNGYKLVDQQKKIYKDNKSSIIELDPLKMEVIWEYTGDEDNPFFSLASGSCQRLPNGNTLITESDRGRVFEVDPAGQIVWEYLNKYRTGKDKKKIAAIFELIRFRPGPDFFLKR